MQSGPALTRGRRARRATLVRRRIAAVLALATITVVAVTIAQSDADPPATIPRSAVRIDVGSTAIARPLPAGFVGLSIEYPSAPGYFGTDPRHPDPVFVQLVRNLTPGQSPVLRFGGDTTDWSWWPTPGVTKPPGVRYTVGPRWVQSTAAAARALDARLILGINFESDSSTIAATEASALVRGIGSRYIAGLELGNEPEVYSTLGWYESPTGAGVPGRPAGYGFGAYLGDYARVERALPGGAPLVGPASGAPQWLDGLSQYLGANPRVRLVTFHRYPLHRCFTARSAPEYPTIANLLSPLASSGPATSLQAAVTVAHAHGIPFRADELNSVSCGGARGVSDTFASALWALDTLFNMDRVGVDGVNIHTFHKATYEPFAVGHASGRWSGQVRPMYYGLLMFARAAPPGSRLLATSGPGMGGSLRTWATRSPDGRVRVVLINDSTRHAVTVAVRAPTTAQAASAQRLRAPRVTAKAGVTLAGQSFGATTTTGRPAGEMRQLALGSIQGRFVVQLPPASATLLTIGAR